MFGFFKREIMLGVGAGLIISGIMISLSGNGQMTDEEVIARASKLGMVQQLEADSSQSGTPQEKPESQKPQVLPGQAETSPAQEPVVEKVSSPEKSQNGPSGTDLTTSEKAGVITIEIRSGMGSETVIRLLKQKGAISDEEEFYKVMTKYNAHSKLKVGTFKIPDGTDMKGIVDILTGKAKTIDN